jgi:hypothetical protein
MTEATKDSAPNADLEHRLEALRQRRAEAAAAREEKKRPAVLQAELEREERALVDDEVIAKLEDERGAIGRAIGVVRTDLGAIVVRRADPAAYKKFADMMARENPKQHELSTTLVQHALLHPTLAEFDRMAQEQPHILIRCANVISELAGVRAKEEAGK